MSSFHSYTPGDGHGLAHDPVSAIVAPRPIGWISTISPLNGAINLAPYSFFNLVNYQPPLLAFSSVGRKDTVQNAITGGSFVWNLVTEDLGRQMNVTSAAVSPDVDEFALAGLTPLASDEVEPPRVAESPASFECRVSDALRLRAASGAALDTWMVLGEVVRVHIDTDLLANGHFDTAGAKPLLRAGGPGDYFIPSAEHTAFMLRPEPMTR